MLDILILICVGYFFYNLGIAVTSYRLRDLIYKEAKARGLTTKADTDLFEDTSPTIFKLWVERSQDILYLYDYDENTFVCQAKTVEELAKLALEYKNIKYAAVIMDDKPLVFVDGVVKTDV